MTKQHQRKLKLKHLAGDLHKYSSYDGDRSVWSHFFDGPRQVWEIRLAGFHLHDDLINEVRSDEHR